MVIKYSVGENKEENREILDLAADLAQEIKNSKEYALYCEARQKLFSDKKQAELLAEYRRHQLWHEFAALSGEDYEENEHNSDKDYQMFSSNPAISDFLYAESRFTRLLNEIQNILGRNLDIWIEVGGSEEDSSLLN